MSELKLTSIGRLDGLLKKVWQWPRTAHFGIAIGAAVLVVLLRYLATPIVGSGAQLVFSTIPVALGALVGGLWPGIAAAAIGLVLCSYFFVLDNVKPEAVASTHIIQLTGFAIVWLFISLVCDALRKTALQSQVLVAERDLQRARLDATLDGITDAFYVVDENWMIVQTNRAFNELAKPYGEVLGKHLWTIFPDREHKEAGVALKVAMATRTEQRVDYFHEPLGRWLHSRMFPNESGIAIYVQDVTENKELEAKRDEILGAERAARASAEEASRLRDEFIALASHELRTPLTTLLGWLELLEKRREDPTMLEPGLEAIERAARQLQKLVEDLLGANRMLLGKSGLDREPLDLAEMLRDAVKQAGREALNKEVTLSWHAAESCGVHADRVQINQLFDNLISNAIKFTPAGGKIRLELRGDGDGHCVMTISDTGQGIDPQFLPYVFDRFRQQSPAITRTKGGLGLGLSVVKAIVEAHGGTVSSESEGTGLGSTFTVKLPLAPEMPMSGDVMDLTGLKLLLVEDDEGTRDVLNRILTGAGAEVTQAASGWPALELLKTMRPHVIISDIGMPELDGYQFIERFRGDERDGEHVPAIAVTAFGREEDREFAESAGFDAFLKKPINGTELILAVSRLAQSHQCQNSM